MNKLREFSSISEAAKILKLERSSIGKCCSGNQKSCGNFKFTFTSA